MPLKVFISHASEDKDRFVLEFAKHLRQKGIDAWLDKWEMLPGDCLVDKIFEEGIKEAKAVIVVLSKFSVEKPWVREELNAAFIKKVNNGSKLIPVVLDACEVPEALKSTLWESITDLSAYDASLERIVASIYGVYDKPPTGPQPEYTQSSVKNISNLNNIDSHVLHLSCEELLKNENVLINPQKVFFRDGKPFISKEELKESLEILSKEGYVKLTLAIGAPLFLYTITTKGFNAYANAAIPDYQSKFEAVVSAIANEGLTSKAKIQEQLKEHRVIVDHILRVLENEGHIKQTQKQSGLDHIHYVSPSLKRVLRSG